MGIKLSEHQCGTKKCLIKGKHSKVKLSPKKDAKGVSYTLENDKNLSISYYDLDDCVYPKKNKKEGFELCDYVIVTYKEENNKKENTYIWVEIKKTSDLNKCCTQILNSYNDSILFDKDITHYARMVIGKFNKNSISNDNQRRVKSIFKDRFDYASQEYSKDKSSNLYLRKL